MSSAQVETRKRESEMDGARLGDNAKELASECQRLREEVDRLRRLLLDNDIDPTESAVAVAPQLKEPRLQLTTAQKIAVFRSLFRGREDVYATRWEIQDGSALAPGRTRVRAAGHPHANLVLGEIEATCEELHI